MARKQVNKNLIVAMTLFSLAMVVVLSVLVLRQIKHRDPTYFVELAKQAEIDGDSESAITFYSKAWERSNEAKHLVSIGELYLKQGEVGRALGSWSTALIHQPDLSDAHLRLIRLRLKIAGLYDQSDDWKALREAAEALQEVGAEMTSAEEAETRHAHGQALIHSARRGDGNARIGESDLLKATELAPGVVSYRIDLAQFYVRQGRVDDGEGLFEAMIRDVSRPGLGATEVRRAYAEFLAGQDRFDEASELFEDSLAMAGDDSEALQQGRLGLALFLTQRWAASPDRSKLFERARSLLTECVAANPQDYEPYLQLATLYGADGRHVDVVSTCDARLALGLERTGVRAARHRFDAFSLMVFASEACISEAAARLQEEDENERQEWLGRAEKYIEQAYSELPSNPRVLVQRAKLKRARGLDRQALEDLRAAQDGYRAAGRISWQTTVALAQLHLELRESGAAKAVLEEFLDEARRERSEDFRFWTLYAQALFQAREPDRALAICENILQANASYVPAQELKVVILQERGRIGDARQAARSLPSDPGTIALIEARGLILEKNEEGALAIMQGALKESPSDPRLVGAAVRILMNLDRADEARELTETALTVDASDKQLRMLHVLTREDLSESDRDDKILELIYDEDDDYQRTLDLIGFYLSKKDYTSLLPLLEEAIGHLTEADTRSAQRASVDQLRTLLETKLTVASSLDNSAAMAAARDKATEFNVDGAGGKSFEGLYHMHRKDYAAAINALREAMQAQPTDARLLAYLGQCHQILAQNGEARAFFDRAVQMNPSEGIAHRGLAVMAKAGGDPEAYERHFALAKSLLPNDPWIKSETLAHEEEKNPEIAILRREKFRTSHPTDVRNLVRLSTLYEAVDDLTRAGDNYAQALVAMPESRELVIAAADFYRRTDRADRALESISRHIESQSSANAIGRAHLLSAAHHLEVGSIGQAEEALKQAAETAESMEVLQALAEFYFRAVNRPDEAIRWFDKAVSVARADQSPRLPRLLALRVSCLMHPELSDVDVARRRCEELLLDFPDYPQGLLLLSEIHSRQGEIEGAVSTITDYLRLRPKDPKAIYHRALLYLALGRTGVAIEDLENLKRVSPLALDLKPRLRLAGLNRNIGRIDRATRELESLVDDAPDSFEALHALVELYLENERVQDADRQVAARINRMRENPDARLYFLRARTAGQLEDFTVALTNAKRGAELNGNDGLSLMRVLGVFLAADWAADGIAFFEQYASNDARPPLISRYARLLWAAGRDQEAVEQFRRAMASAIKRGPAEVGIVSVDLRGAFADAAAAGNAFALFERSVPEGLLARANDRIVIRLLQIAARTDDAIERLRTLIDSCQNDPERALLWHELGDLYQQGDRPAEARRAYEEALKYDGEYWITLNNLASVLSDKFAEYVVAEPYAKRAIEASDNPDTRDTLGWIYVGQRDYERGIAELTQAVRQGSSNPLHFYHLGEAYRMGDRSNDAASILQVGRQRALRAGDSDLIQKFDASIDKNSSLDSSP